MKRTPFKTRRTYSPFMQADPSLSGGGEEKEEIKEDTSVGEDVASFLTPQNKLELALAAFGGAGKLGTKFLKTKAGQKLISKFPSLSKLTKPISQSTKKTEFDFTGKRDFSGKAKQMEVVKHNAKIDANIQKYGQGDPNILPTPKTDKEFYQITKNAIGDVKGIGSKLDDAGYSIKNLDPKKSVKKIGQVKGTKDKPGQTIYEVTYPGGEKLRYWQSSGRGEKGIKFRQSHNEHLNNPAIGASKDYFGVLPGHMDASNVKVFLDKSGGMKTGSKQWFIKDTGWEQGYGSNVIEDTGIWLKSLKDNNII